MLIVPRTCTPPKHSNATDTQPQSVSLASLQNCFAYVLLGDPGAGKSRAFKTEAEALDTTPITARDFITYDQSISHWQGKTIFIDGLDETRAGNTDGRTPLDQIRKKLDQLGRPRFRLSCRAADWLGQSDAAGLKNLAPENDFGVYLLDPLTENDIAEILKTNHNILDAATFIAQAENHRLTDLLENPQTLTMLAEAVGPESNWPNSRTETYQLACNKLLTESNQEHIAATVNTRSDSERLIDAAGYLCCQYLIADLGGISQLPTGDRYAVCINDLHNPDQLPLAECVRTRLFKSISSNVFAPTHRTIAEYLAASFLAKKVDADLPLGRVLALICGADGGVVSDMRGLSAWLSTTSTTARKSLIDKDPLGVLLYGDAKSFAASDKLAILAALHREATFSTSFRWQDWRARPFAALATPDMAKEFEKLLQSDSREPADISIADIVIEALYYGDPLAGFSGALLLDIAEKTSWPDAIRKWALMAYLKNYLGEVEPALKLLNEIHGGKVKDIDDELTGVLLENLYPAHIGASEILKYLHATKNSSFIGDYDMFWRRAFIEKTSDDKLRELLTVFCEGKRTDLRSLGRNYWQPASKLLARGLETHGNNASDEEIFNWLEICLVNHYQSKMEADDCGRLHAWFAGRPNRYKSILRVSLNKIVGRGKPIHEAEARLHRTTRPADIGVWWLAQAEAEANSDLAQNYFGKSFWINENGVLHDGLSLEELENWVAARPQFATLLASKLTSNFAENAWRMEDAQREAKATQEKHEEIKYFRELMSALKSNSANANDLYLLASVYVGHHANAKGATPADRLRNYLNSDEELIAATFFALQNSINRADLPSTQEIIELSATKRQQFEISNAILVGVELIFESEPANFQSLPDDVLGRVVASYYTDGANAEPIWFEHLVETKPTLLSQIFIEYVLACFANKSEHIYGIYALANDAKYSKIAMLSTPTLLRKYPPDNGNMQFSAIEYLLKAAIRHLPTEAMKTIVAEKLTIPNFDTGQHVYWLTTGFIVDPTIYSVVLAEYIGSDPTRIEHLGNFLYSHNHEWHRPNDLSNSNLALLIALLSITCEPERPSQDGYSARYRAELVRGYINQLASSGDKAATATLQELEHVPKMAQWSAHLRHARLAQKTVLRDASYAHPEHKQVSAAIYKGLPVNAADLAAIVNEVLQALSNEVRHSDLNIYKQFWNVDSYGRPEKSKPEESCRDVLALILREQLMRYSINCQPETQHVDKKRSDLWCTCNALGVPIEIKKDTHKDLWRSLNEQLAAQYVIEPRAQGHGIYLVLWFGGDGMPLPPNGLKPQNIQELKRLLEKQIKPEQRHQISVWALDCSRAKPE